MDGPCCYSHGWDLIIEHRSREKKLNLFIYVFIVNLTLLSSNAFSTQFTHSSSSCSKKFEGVVEQVLEPEAPVHNFSKRTVIFKVSKKLKGVIADVEQVKLLKFGPVSVEKGQIYEVQLEKESICSIQRISSH